LSGSCLNLMGLVQYLRSRGWKLGTRTARAASLCQVHPECCGRMGVAEFRGRESEVLSKTSRHQSVGTSRTSRPPGTAPRAPRYRTRRHTLAGRCRPAANRAQSSRRAIRRAQELIPARDIEDSNYERVEPAGIVDGYNHRSEAAVRLAELLAAELQKGVPHRFRPCPGHGPLRDPRPRPRPCPWQKHPDKPRILRCREFPESSPKLPR
jgi:hypothetical protein